MLPPCTLLLLLRLERFEGSMIRSAWRVVPEGKGSGGNRHGERLVIERVSQEGHGWRPRYNGIRTALEGLAGICKVLAPVRRLACWS